MPDPALSDACFRPWRVYVSGFHDWPRDRAEARDFPRWRCRLNPSGRLLLGRAYRGAAKPRADRGPLPRLLRRLRRTRSGRPIVWTFETLPVLWGSAASIPHAEHDVVINLGLGLYGRPCRRLRLELGAINRRAAQVDAAARVAGEGGGPPQALAPGQAPGAVLVPPPHLARRLALLRERRLGGYRVELAPARASNAFVCNETHFLGLRRLRDAGPRGRPRWVFFVHIGAPRRLTGYAGLAKALALLIAELLEPEESLQP